MTLTRAIVEQPFFQRQLKVFADRPAHLIDMLEHTVSKYPEQEALVLGGVRLTYQEMSEQIRPIAVSLHKNYGIRKGDRIAILLNNSINFSLLVFACAAIGAILVPLNTRLHEKELAYMLNHSGAKAFIIDEEFEGKGDVLKHTYATDLKGISHFFITGNKRRSRSTNYINFSILLEDQGVNDLPDVDVREEDTLFIMYTSGTTGRPKGAMLSHLGVLHSALNYEQVLHTDHGTRTLIAVPLFHVTGLIGQLVHMVLVGGTAVLIRRYQTHVFMRIVAEEKVNFLFNVPTIYVMMLTHEEFPTHNFDSISIIAYGGAPMSAQTIDQLKSVFPGVSLHNAYGATETSSPATIMPQQYSQEHILSIGLPVPVAELKVVNDQGKSLPANEVGELWVKGPMVIHGYWNNEEANQKAFVDGYWLSGDMAKINDEGFVYLMDRKKDMIIRGGENIYTVEVENVLYAHTQVLEAAVVGIPHHIFGQEVKAYIVPQPDATVTEEEIKDFVEGQLAAYKVPTMIEFVAELPRNPGGKVMKSQLTDEY